MFYIKEEERVVLFDNDRDKLEQTLLFMPQYSNLSIQETNPDETIIDFVITTIDQARRRELELVKQQKLDEALEKAYEYERKTGFVTFNGRVVNEDGTRVLSIELSNQSKFFQLVMGFAQGLLTEDFIYCTKEDVNVRINEQEAKAIYYAITQKLSELWTATYPQYKEVINACANVEEVKNIVINYVS